jgi:fibronectin type 3 domain-containing protein
LLDLESFKIYREDRLSKDRCASCPKDFKLLYEYAYKGPRGKVPEKDLYVYTDTAVTPGHVYTYKIHCTSEQGMLGEASNAVTVFWDTPPAPPQKLQLERKGKLVLLTWEGYSALEQGASAGDIAGYNVYRSEDKGIYENAPLNDVPIIGTSFEDQPDAYDKTYYYTVRAVSKVFDSYIESAPSAECYLVYGKITSPTAPLSLTAIPEKEGMLLKWQAKSEPGIAGFNIYRKDAGGGDFMRINKDIIQENSWLDRSARIGKKYIYAVTAVDDSINKNESALSAPVTVVHLP